MFLTPEAKLRQNVGELVQITTKKNKVIVGYIKRVDPYLDVYISDPIVDGIYGIFDEIRLKQAWISTIKYMQ